MSWNPFGDLVDGISSVASWVGNGFESFGNDLWSNAIGPALDFVDPSGALHTTDRQRLADETNRFNLYSAQKSLEHQLDYDKWAQKLTEINSAWQRDFAEKQFQEQSDLARHPFSTLLADASQNGVSPLAALGQNVGSVSVGSSQPSTGNSSVGNNQAAIHLSQMNTLPSLMQTLSQSVLGKEQQRLTKEMFDDELHYKYTALQTGERIATARNQVQLSAQKIISDFNSHKKSIDLSNLQLAKDLNEQQISELQSQILALRGSYDKDMQEIEHMKNLDESQKQSLRNEREKTWVSAVAGVLQSVIGAASNLAGKGAFPF